MGRVAMRKLLTYSNYKTQLGESRGILTAILHLSPADLSGHEVCQSRTRGCTAVCLNSAGRGGAYRNSSQAVWLKRNDAQRARIWRTKLLFRKRDTFMAQ